MHKAFDILKKQRLRDSSPILGSIENYLVTGDKKLLAKINKEGSWQIYSALYSIESALVASLDYSESMDLTNRYLLDVLTNLNLWHSALLPVFAKEKETQNLFAPFHESMKKCGFSKSKIVEAAIGFGKCVSAGKPNSALRFLLSLSDDDLSQAIGACTYNHYLIQLTSLLVESAPKRIGSLLDWLVWYDPSRISKKFKNKHGQMITEAACEILRQTGDQYEKPIFELWNKIEDVVARFESGYELSKVRPKRFLEPTKKACQEYMKKPEGKNNLFVMSFRSPDLWVFEFIIEHFQMEYADEIKHYLLKDSRRYYTAHIAELLTLLDQSFAEKALPFFETALKNEFSGFRLKTLQCMVNLDRKYFLPLLEEQLHKELKGKEELLQFLLLAKRWKPDRFEEDFWTLLGNKSKPVREAAARTLGEISKLDLDRVTRLLADKRADTRDCAVTILSQLKTDQAIRALESRIDEEENDDIRDKILKALETAWETKGKKITMKTIEQRMDRAAEKVDRFKADWFDFKKMPPLMIGKKKMDEQAVRYLLYRQSRCKEMRPDVEGKPLLVMIDRKTSADFALFVLHSFLDSKMDVNDRWALALAGLLGDDRIVPILTKQIQVWADSYRGKLSEYGVESLALLGTEAALTAVSGMIVRYRTKYRNIKTAAETVFEQVALDRNMTVDELGDRVVPALGFKRNEPRQWTFGDNTVTLRVGMDFKLTLYHEEKKKFITALPKTAPKEIVEEFKEVRDALKEVLKGQKLRIENMLVRQYRWPIDRWQDLYCTHPVLRPFTVRLVWGLYDDKGRLKTTFRSLEDGSLTDVNDEQVQLPKTGKVGIIHPLELTDKQRNDWQQHLLDFEIVPPFPQLDRSVIFPTEEESTQLSSDKFFGTILNAMTFKDRAERAGWRRGSVCDGGMVTAYMKPFTESGVDAFLSIEGFFVGISRDEQITVENLCFVKSNSVQIGSYVYDDPGTRTNDDRLIPFGKVPPIVYSEVMGDMQKIAPVQKET